MAGRDARVGRLYGFGFCGVVCGAGGDAVNGRLYGVGGFAGWFAVAWGDAWVGRLDCGFQPCLWECLSRKISHKR